MTPKSELIPVDIRDLPGLKEEELLKLGNCPICDKKLLEDNRFTFYKVTVSRCILDPKALQRRVGLAMLLQSDTLARVMGPNEDLAKVFGGPTTVIVHENCASKIHHLLELIPPLASLIE